MFWGTYMTISLRVVSSIMYLVQSFQLSYVFDWSTIFWNIVLFLLRQEVRPETCNNLTLNLME